MNSPDDHSTGPVIRDRRRIDPITGQVRDPDLPGGAAAPGQTPGGQVAGKHAAGRGEAPSAGSTQADSSPKGSASSQDGAGSSQADEERAAALAQVKERTADLQRLQAEYANYRKRVERDRTAVREQSLANVLTELLPVLDDIGRAREHGELSGGFKSVAESLEATVGKLGLTSFGEEGEPFDPNLHEALMHEYSDEVTEPTSVRVLQPGYKVGSRILRPARVAVAEPGGPGPASSSGEPASGRAQPDQDEVTGKPQEAGESGNAAAGQEAAGPSGASGPSGAPGPPGAEAD